MTNKVSYREIKNLEENQSSDCLSFLNCLFPESTSNKELDPLQPRKKEKVYKLLLLGAGDSGKSTFLKQIKYINNRDVYKLEEAKKFRDVVFMNTLTSIRQLIGAMKNYSIEYEIENNQNLAQEIWEIPETDLMLRSYEHINEKLGEKIKSIWNDQGIQKAYEIRSSFNLMDSAAYFLSKVETICKTDYIPTKDDIVRTRQKTTGIVETDFMIDGNHFKIVDVGGQRNERKKWVHTFDDVTAVIFVTSLSEYNQKLLEGDKQNRMKESILLFDDLCNTEYLKSPPIIIFFNKKDIFEEKIKKIDLNCCFPDYKDGNDEKKALEFIKNRFIERDSKKKRQIYAQLTCATDTNNVQLVFDVVKSIALENRLKDYHLL